MMDTKGSKETRAQSLGNKRGRDMTIEEAHAALSDVVSLCAKILHDRETAGVVQEADIEQLRESIGAVLDVVHKGPHGFKAFEGRLEKGSIGGWRKSL
jgi:hypothetical protein